MMNEFEIKRHVGILSTKYGMNKEVNLISWDGKRPVLDIREWDESHNKMMQGMTFDAEEMQELYRLLKELMGDDSSGRTMQRRSLKEAGDTKYSKPQQLSFRGRTYEVANWRDIYLTICAALYNDNKELFRNTVLSPEMQGKRRKHYSTDSKDLVVAREIANSGIYVDINRSANNICDTVLRLLNAFNEDPGKVFIDMVAV